jgi:hypothetical protein
MKGTSKAFKNMDKAGIKAGTQEPAQKKTKSNSLQAQYDAECRKLNAARALKNDASVEAIKLCGENIARIKKEALEVGSVLDIASDESFGTDEPHLVKRETGEVLFVCGTVSFEVDPRSLDKTIGASGYISPLEKLLDSQLVEIARLSGLQVEPFVRSLLMLPLTGVLQAVWYRDIRGHDSEHLRKGQADRIAEYHRRISVWKEDTPSTEEGGSESKTRTPRQPKGAGKIVIDNAKHKQLLKLHKEGKSTGEIAVAIGMERSKSARAAVRQTLAALLAQKRGE